MGWVLRQAAEQFTQHLVKAHINGVRIVIRIRVEEGAIVQKLTQNHILNQLGFQSVIVSFSATWRSQLGLGTVRIHVLKETLVAEWTLAPALVEMATRFLTAGFDVFIEECLLLLGPIHPVPAGTHKVAMHAAFGAATRHFRLELFRGAPLTDTRDAEAVIASGQNAEPLHVTTTLFHDSFHTDSTRFPGGIGHAERVFHVCLEHGETLGVVRATLFGIVRM